MSNQQILINETQWNELKQKLNSLKDQKKAINRAVRRTATGGKTLIAKRIGEKVTLKAAFIKKGLIVRFSDEKEKATISIQNTSIPLSNFLVYPNSGAKKTKNGLTVKMFKDKSPVKFKHAFWATMKSGHVGVFMREMRGGRAVARLKINELRGINLASVYDNTSDLATEVETELTARLARELDAQVAYILSQRATP